MVKARSPGPIYKLPPTIGYNGHDYSKYRNPQFTMSPRLGDQFKGGIGPGPVYQVRGFTEHGKESPPAYSLVARYKDVTKFAGPGPGAHSPEKCLRMKEPRPPAYTMRPRVTFQNETIGPGPLAYSLPSMIGPRVPNKLAYGAYTISPRLGVIDKTVSPGPATYPGLNTNIYKLKAPQYTMRPVWGAIPDKTNSPGPAGYALKVLPGKTAPVYSMGRLFAENASPYITAQDIMPCKKN